MHFLTLQYGFVRNARLYMTLNSYSTRASKRKFLYLFSLIIYKLYININVGYVYIKHWMPCKSKSLKLWFKLGQNNHPYCTEFVPSVVTLSYTFHPVAIPSLEFEKQKRLYLRTPSHQHNMEYNRRRFNNPGGSIRFCDLGKPVRSISSDLNFVLESELISVTWQASLIYIFEQRSHGSGCYRTGVYPYVWWSWAINSIISCALAPQGEVALNEEHNHR